MEELVAKLNPRQTALLLGAGASIPSGAPSGVELGRRLSIDLAPSTSDSDYSLSEVCSIYERQLGREALASQVAALLRAVEPTGGIQLLPRFDWYRIYGTNFDQLVERVYASAKVPLVVRRSNFDFSRQADPGALEYYKIHGCISEDVGFGHKSRMLLTEEDYESYADFREAAFRALSADILTKDLLIVGQSLVDPHLKELVRDALRIRAKSGTPGRVFVLAFARDEQRALIHQGRGAEVYFGSLDSLLGGLLESLPPEEQRASDASPIEVFEPTLLPAALISVTTDAAHAMSLMPNVRAVFNGSPATYADIAAGHTFRRSEHARIVESLAERPIAVLLGAGGVGKTTLARQVLLDIGNGVDAAWEHTNAFPLRADYWIEYEKRLREFGKRAVLLVDDCVDNLSQVSQIADHLGRESNPALRVLLTATTGKWQQRSKSRYVFSHGNAFTLSRLSREDINELLRLTALAAIRELVEPSFLSLPPGEQFRILRERCSADMYVCMKNIFASEELDYILLREYGELEQSAQDIYRSVSALEALGARVHRQLVMRLLGLEAGALAATLASLTGIVTEFDIRPRDGLFGWETRHRVIAATIARYKYAQQAELDRLFEALIDSINPSVRLEVETARALCTEEYGIDRLSDPTRQVDLLHKVVRLLPGESIPRHRLIRHLIDQDRLDDAARELRNAGDAIRPNPVLARYEVLLLVRKAELTPGLMAEDRVAILLDAAAKANGIITRYPDDMHSYRIYGDVGIALAGRGAGVEVLQDAIRKASEAETRILDPALGEVRRRMESELRKAA
ncbi:SIR2 family NAD-dependent protein deacylase [Cellulomonas carbonis]|uniref:SIR2 family NAD-dependent protein deacylase n=1 Tax=Cellulomonas carbonis TaxID=1386092 RepID=UPI00126A413C|nr:SIR2 family protein [Cellulomonas carbonis]